MQLGCAVGGAGGYIWGLSTSLSLVSCLKNPGWGKFGGGRWGRGGVQNKKRRDCFPSILPPRDKRSHPRSPNAVRTWMGSKTGRPSPSCPRVRSRPPPGGPHRCHWMDQGLAHDRTGDARSGRYSVAPMCVSARQPHCFSWAIVYASRKKSKHFFLR